MNLSRGVEDKKKGLCKYINSKRKTRGNLNPMLKSEEELLTKGMEKIKILSAFFASDFTGKTSLQESQTLETRRKSGARKNYP